MDTLSSIWSVELTRYWAAKIRSSKTSFERIIDLDSNESTHTHTHTFSSVNRSVIETGVRWTALDNLERLRNPTASSSRTNFDRRGESAWRDRRQGMKKAACLWRSASSVDQGGSSKPNCEGTSEGTRGELVWLPNRWASRLTGSRRCVRTYISWWPTKSPPQIAGRAFLPPSPPLFRAESCFAAALNVDQE